MIYKTKGTCSEQIHIEIDNDMIKEVKFVKGCPGLTQALERMLIGIGVEEPFKN